MTRHPATEGNELHPSDVYFPNPSGGDGRLSLKNDVAAEFSALALSNTRPDNMPDGGLWVNLSAEPTGLDRLQTYDSSTNAFIPITADQTIVAENEPEPQRGLLWFEPVDGGSNLYAASSDRWEFLHFIPARPETQINRAADDQSSTVSYRGGIGISVGSVDIDGIKADISANTSGLATAYLTETDGTVLASTDVSGLLSEQEFSISQTLSANTTYYLVGDNNGSEYTIGYEQSGDITYPLDGAAFDLVNGVFSSTSTDGLAYNFNNIRNLNYSP